MPLVEISVLGAQWHRQGKKDIKYHQPYPLSSRTIIKYYVWFHILHINLGVSLLQIPQVLSASRQPRCLLSPLCRWGVSLLSPRQVVSVFSLRPLCVPRRAAGHGGAALSGLESRPGQLRPRLAVWWKRSLPGDLASSGLWREPAGSPHHHTQPHCWQHHSAIWCLLLQRYCNIGWKPMPAFVHYFCLWKRLSKNQS